MCDRLDGLSGVDMCVFEEKTLAVEAFESSGADGGLDACWRSGHDLLRCGNASGGHVRGVWVDMGIIQLRAKCDPDCGDCDRAVVFGGDVSGYCAWGNGDGPVGFA
ncbi:MAG: hypothetical protein II767_07180 [Proteobacteria bacterium]|nr:hypothetical protein [Pseudomonadota bacterium]